MALAASPRRTWGNARKRESPSRSRPPPAELSLSYEASTTIRILVAGTACFQARRQSRGRVGGPAWRGRHRVRHVFHPAVGFAGERRGRLEIHLPAHGGGECNRGCRTGRFRGLRPAAAVPIAPIAGHNELLQP